MRKLFITIITILFLSSCNFFGPIDSNIQTKNVNFNEADISGTWKLDKFSYEYLSDKENLDSIYITFNADSTFILNNSRNLFKSKSYTSEFSNVKQNGIIDNMMTSGKWRIIDYKATNLKVLELVYDNKVSQNGINVYKKDSEYQIWYFFGDPDSGERLRFLKE